MEKKQFCFGFFVGIRALLMCLDAIVISTVNTQMCEPTTGNKFVNTKFFPLSKAAIETFSALPPLALYFKLCTSENKKDIQILSSSFPGEQREVITKPSEGKCNSDCLCSSLLVVYKQ